MLPVGERIREKVFTRLQKLEAGYDQNAPVSSVVRPTSATGDVSPEPWQIVMLDGDTNDERLFPGNPPKQETQQTIDIHVNVTASEKDPAPLTKLYAFAKTAVRRVITLDDTTNWYSWDGLAVNTMWGAIEPSSLNGVPTINIPIIVWFRTDEGNPYNSRA